MQIAFILPMTNLNRKSSWLATFNGSHFLSIEFKSETLHDEFRHSLEFRPTWRCYAL